VILIVVVPNINLFLITLDNGVGLIYECMIIYSLIVLWRKTVSSSYENCNEDLCHVRVIHADQVEKVRRDVLPDEHMDRLALIYRMLGDPTRLKILMALKQVELCVCDIAAYLGISESAVSHQLRRLRDASIVRHRREGQVLYYMLNDAHVETLLDVGIDHVHERSLQ
jgi:ArsR family transcriptional regulator, lead/cadmium/zinc/bismuth-responsive transcriptional repressor